MSALFPNVPDFPGVPPVNRIVGQITDALGLTTGGVGGGYQQAAPVWGIFDSDLTQVLTGASFVGLEYAGDYPISDAPQEQGAFESYNKVQKPFMAKITLARGGTSGERAAFLNEVNEILSNLSLYSVITPERTYDSVNMTHADYSRRVEKGATLILASLHFEQVRVTANATFSNTQQPEGAAVQNGGGVQTRARTPAEFAASSGGAT